MHLYPSREPRESVRTAPRTFRKLTEPSFCALALHSPPRALDARQLARGSLEPGRLARTPTFSSRLLASRRPLLARSLAFASPNDDAGLPPVPPRRRAAPPLLLLRARALGRPRPRPRRRDGRRLHGHRRDPAALLGHDQPVEGLARGREHRAVVVPGRAVHVRSVRSPLLLLEPSVPRADVLLALQDGQARSVRRGSGSSGSTSSSGCVESRFSRLERRTH